MRLHRFVGAFAPKAQDASVPELAAPAASHERTPRAWGRGLSAVGSGAIGLGALALGLALTPLAGPPAPALAAHGAPLPPDQQVFSDRAAAYLQSLRNVRSRFTQTDPNGQVSTGAFYLQRPGKARFQYDPPSGLLIVCDGRTVAVADSRLKTYDRYPLARTPLVLLLAKQVRLDRGVTITNVEQTDTGFILSAKDARGQAEGRLNLAFGDDPVTLQGWTIVSAQGRTTRVQLGALTSVDSLDPSLFALPQR